jgi:hypothetical protein
MNYTHPSQVPAGTVVAVPIRVGLLTVVHPGLVTDRCGPDGLPTVINASKRRDRRHVEETWSQYAEGNPVTLQRMPTTVGVAEMLRRARADLGKPWDLLGANCEHAIRRWRGLVVESPQLQAGIVLAAVVALALAALWAARR